jgi:regulator of cell morphogenesis and NO signaling
MTITEQTTITEIARSLPWSVRVFQRHRIDFCCGAKRPLATACREQGLSFTDIAREIEVSCPESASEQRNWSREPLRTLIRYILTAYHEPLRQELPRLEAMASKVSRVHGAKASHLGRVDAIVAELAADLRSHMRKEELVLFPAIDALDAGAPRSCMPISPPIVMMEHEHDHAGDLLEELRRITNGYEPPEWACATLRALYHGLEELESAMHVHVHLENNVLFPRALALERRE